MPKKFLTVLLVALMSIALLLTACGPAEQDPASSSQTPGESKADPTDAPKEATIQFWYTTNEADPDDMDNIWLTETLEMFKDAYPHIKVETTIIGGAGGDNYRAKLSAEIASKNTPDVFMTWLDQVIAPFVRQGAVLALNDVVEEDEELKALVNKDNLLNATFDGKFYSIPNAISMIGLFYNKALFKEYNLEVPKSLDELYAVSDEFRKNDIIPIALGNNVTWLPIIPYMHFLADDIGYENYNTMILNQDINFSKPEFKRAMLKVKEIVDKRVFNDDFNAIAPAESRAIFEERDAAMFLQGTWNMLAVENALGEDAGFIGFPNMSGQEMLIKVPTKGYAVSSTSKEEEAALTFFKFMYSKERQSAFAQLGNVTALNNIELDEASVGPLFKDLLALNESPAKVLVHLDEVGLNVAVRNEFRESVQAATAGEDIDQLLENLQQFKEMND